MIMYCANATGDHRNASIKIGTSETPNMTYMKSVAFSEFEPQTMNFMIMLVVIGQIISVRASPRLI